MCLQQWYARLLGELPSLCRQLLSLPFSPQEETELTFLDSDTNTATGRLKPLLLDDRLPLHVHVWDVVFAHRGGSLDLLT